MTENPKAVGSVLEYPAPGQIRAWMRAHPIGTSMLVVGAFLFLHLPGVVIAGLMPIESTWVVIVGVLFQSVLIWFRNYKPWLMYVLAVISESIVVLLVNGASGGMSMFFLSYTLGRRYGIWRSVLFIVPGTLLVMTYYLTLSPAELVEVFAEDGPPPDTTSEVGLMFGFYAGILISILVSLLIAGVGDNIRRSRAWEDNVRRWAIETRQLAQAQERNEIAREMHDVVAHSLSVMISLADGAKSAIDRNPDQAKEVLGHASAAGRSALADMRRMIGILRAADTTEFAPQPSEAGLPQLLENFQQAGLPVRFSSEGDPLPESKTRQLTVYRIIQESLTNALRYAHNATEVHVRLLHEPEKITITVTDNGTSSTDVKSVGAGQGLAGIKERAALYGGVATAGPRRSATGQGLAGIKERAALYGGVATAGPRRSATGHRIGWHVHVELPSQEES
ncbi:sensor histidine kinase [Micrococcoides hystricis]|uniref:histidine kinase n=1 Tax=Micrococcoides hystricis TaxID=1572761 RepID=A0ABV6PBM5_9MICC